MKLIIASNNAGKIKEFKKMLTPLGYEPVSMKEAGIDTEIPEDGTTFSENAHIKAKTIYDITHTPVLAVHREYIPHDTQARTLQTRTG